MKKIIETVSFRMVEHRIEFDYELHERANKKLSEEERQEKR